MNVEADTKPAGDDWRMEVVPAGGWSWKKTISLIVLAFVAHLALVFIFGAKKMPAARTVTNVPQFQFAANDPELIALDDPTLFALPHVEDFFPAVWRRMPDITVPSARPTETPPFLLPQAGALGAAFNEFMQTNRFAAVQLSFKPEPVQSSPFVPAISMLPDHSTWRLAGDLAHRQLLQPINVPTLTTNDVIAPNRVQLLVDTAGRVVSDVLLDSSGSADADQQALKIARAARFAPADRLMFGELIFTWHTVPVPETTTNAPAGTP